MDLAASLFIGTGNVFVKEYLVRFHVQLPNTDASGFTLYGMPPGGRIDEVVALEEGFNHPFVITHITCSGFSLILLFLWLRSGPDSTSRVSQASPFHLDPAEVPPRVYLYAALLFYWASVLVNMNYAVLSGSVIQMLRGSKVVFTYLLSVYVLEKRMQPYHAVGATMCVCGCLVVGLHETCDTSADGGSSGKGILRQEALVAIMMAVASELLRSLLFVYQEQRMRDYQIPPMKLVGVQGAICLPIGMVSMYVANWMGIEDVPRAYGKLVHSPQLECLALVLMVVSTLWESSATVLTKRYSAVVRTLLELTRTMSLWMVDMIVGYEVFSIYHVFALALLILGILIYQHALVIPLLEPRSEDVSEEKPINAASKA